MDHLKRFEITPEIDGGFELTKAFGQNAYLQDEDASMFWTRISETSSSWRSEGVQTAYVVEAAGATLLCGNAENSWLDSTPLETGTVIRTAADEWYKVRLDGQEAFAELVVFAPSH